MLILPLANLTTKGIIFFFFSLNLEKRKEFIYKKFYMYLVDIKILAD